MAKLFDELMKSVQQMDEIVQGKRKPSREFTVKECPNKNIRKKL